MNKTYLGDSVYAEIIDGMIRLTTENGGMPSNEIFLEENVYDTLTEWVDSLRRNVREREVSE